jgi:pimeloyl-ACP methyl ester carboxylesterase
MTSFPSNKRDLAGETGAIDGLAFASDGEGPALLFVHSGIADRRMWAPQIDALAPFFRCLRVDLRGFGESGPRQAGATDHDDLAALLDALGVDRAVVIGSSFGGNVAVDFALTHPERVAGLVLAATLAGMTTPGPALRRIWEETDAALEAGELDRGVDLEVRAWVDGPRRAPEQVDPSVREQVRAMNRTIWERAATEEQVESDAPPIDRAGRLDEIAVPVLLIEGELDQPDVAASLQLLTERIPNAELRIIGGAAHFPNLERPDEFNALALAFLERIGFGQ